MDSSSDSGTSPILLARLQRAPTDQAAWGEFVERYGARIYGWCRQWKLQEADARDVTQDVLLKLSERLRTFRYDPARSFRGWLRTLAHHAWNDFVAARSRTVGGGGGDSDILQQVEARQDLLQRLEEQFDQELFDEAAARVQRRVESRTWEAFRMLALEGCSGAEAAGKLGMKVATVFVARSKVQKLLRQELAKLDEPVPD